MIAHLVGHLTDADRRAVVGGHVIGDHRQPDEADRRALDRRRRRSGRCAPTTVSPAWLPGGSNVNHTGLRRQRSRSSYWGMFENPEYGHDARAEKRRARLTGDADRERRVDALNAAHRDRCGPGTESCRSAAPSGSVLRGAGVLRVARGGELLARGRPADAAGNPSRPIPAKPSHRWPITNSVCGRPLHPHRDGAWIDRPPATWTEFWTRLQPLPLVGSSTVPLPSVGARRDLHRRRGCSSPRRRGGCSSERSASGNPTPPRPARRRPGPERRAA